MIHDLMFNELVVESLYRPMLKLKVTKLQKKNWEVTQGILSLCLYEIPEKHNYHADYSFYACSVDMKTAK